MIFLDIDDTLIDHSGAERRAAELFGQKYKDSIPAFDSNRFAIIWKQESDKHFERFLKKELTFQEQRQERIRGILQNPSLSDNEADQIFTDYLSTYQSSWVLFDDVLPFLRKFKERGLAVISDGGQSQQEMKLSETGILEFFKAVITAESVGSQKPCASIFEYAGKRVGSKLSNCKYIGDNLAKDAIGASEAGMTGVWLNRNNLQNEYTGLTISTLEDFHE